VLDRLGADRKGAWFPPAWPCRRVVGVNPASHGNRPNWRSAFREGRPLPWPPPFSEARLPFRRLMGPPDSQGPGWTKEIVPKGGWLHIPAREIWAYRDLIWIWTGRSLTATYKQTVLGPLWFLIQPFITTVVFTIVFGKIGKIPTDGLPKFLFYLSGVVMWNYFADCVSKTADTFGSNNNIFSKVYFPRLVMPISAVLTSLVTFAIQFTFFVGFYIYFISQGVGVEPSWRIVTLPLMILQMAMLGIGVGCLVSSMTTRYRDLKLLVGFGIQLWMYASCVVYPLSEVAKDRRVFFVLNPMVPIIEGFRFAFLGSGVVEKWHLGVGFGVSFLVMMIGLVTFGRVERTFADTV